MKIWNVYCSAASLTIVFTAAHDWHETSILLCMYAILCLRGPVTKMGADLIFIIKIEKTQSTILFKVSSAHFPIVLHCRRGSLSN